MKIIHKYPLWEGALETRVQTHQGAKVLKLALQNSREMVWMMVDPNLPKAAMLFKIVATGSPLSDDISKWEYLDTVIVAEDAYVWHIFWKWENDNDGKPSK